jgi:hypothetical protein
MRRHDFDGLSFAFGLLFAVVGVLLIGGVTLRESLFVAWAGPAFLIALAVVIVLAARPRSNGGDDEDAATDSPAEA